ncbi:MAG: helicase-related protein [Candidatus Cloacimonadales bacterium]|nr:helicase-related protein [Candidatus Cloacimonadales bacterium]
MPDIIDNREEKLADHLNQIMQTSESARMAVGYFFLSGFNTVAKTISNLTEVKLLIGNTSNRETIEQLAEGYRRLELVADTIEENIYAKNSIINERIENTSNNIKSSIELMDQTDDNEELIKLLIKLITDRKLHVKVYTKGRLHSKAYIFHYGSVYDANGTKVVRHEKGTAVVGSSNLTLAGLTNNTELNVMVHGNDNLEVLKKWFDRLWLESEDFNEHLMQELKSSWAAQLYTPYDVYMKTIYTLVKDRLEDAESKEILWDDDITKQLADFQLVAVKQAVQIIRMYGGCFISDVVGLGKSYIGAAILKHFERTEHVRPLIICPAALTEMWERYNEVYNLNARILSMGFLREDTEDNYNILLENIKYRDRDFVLIDESHNFRNNDTQRYRILEQYLSYGRIKCCLLTATPRNKNIWDIYNQLKLFHQEEQTELPIDPPNLRNYFKLIESGDRQLPLMLSNLLIRRTRKHVLRFYGYDSKTKKPIDSSAFSEYSDGSGKAYVIVGGKEQYFPTRQLETVTYSIEESYQGLYKHIRNFIGKETKKKDVIKSVDQLCYARYGLWHYVKKEKKEKLPYSELQRAGINIRGLIRILLFKRLESSIYAFRESIHKMLDIHNKFLKAMEKGYIPAGQDVQKILYYETDMEVFLDKLANEDTKYRIADFDKDKLKGHIKHDLDIFAKILDLVNPIKPEQDDKLSVLKKLIDDPDIHEDKILIFTQYADTAKYLFENLNPQKKDDTIEAIYSGDKSKERVIGRFAPVANPEYILKQNESQIRILIATDVFSEGLNLQDCNRIINYDLHWNPVRLIQRFGRIDRIGTEFDMIYGYNFLPETGIEKHLGLYEKLTNRIQEIHDTIGEDTAILDKSEQLNEKAMYTIYEKKGNQLSLFDEDDSELLNITEIEEILRQIKRENPEEYERIINLPDGIRACKLSEKEKFYVLCEAKYHDNSNLKNYKQLYLVNNKNESISKDIPTILGVIKAEKFEIPGNKLPDGYNKSLMKIKQMFSETVIIRESEKRYSYALTLGQQHIIRELRILNNHTDNDDTIAKIQVLESAFRNSISSAIKKELNLLRRNSVAGEDLIKALGEIYTQHDMSKMGYHGRKNRGKPIEKIICSEWIGN